MTGSYCACAAVLAAAGCSQVFDLDHIAGPDAPVGVSLCAADDFSSAELDTTRWGVGGQASGVAITVDSGTLRFDVPASTTPTQDPYGSIQSPALDLTGGSVEIEIVEAAPATSDGGSFMQIHLDPRNHYDLLTQHGKLVARSDLDAVVVDMPETFSMALHRVQRLRHDAASNEIVWESHGSGADWHELRREPFAFDPSAVLVTVFAGSFDLSPAYTVRYDNVVIYGRCGG